MNHSGWFTDTFNDCIVEKSDELRTKFIERVSTDVFNEMMNVRYLQRDKLPAFIMSFITLGPFSNAMCEIPATRSAMMLDSAFSHRRFNISSSKLSYSVPLHLIMTHLSPLDLLKLKRVSKNFMYNVDNFLGGYNVRYFVSSSPKLMIFTKYDVAIMRIYNTVIENTDSELTAKIFSPGIQVCVDVQKTKPRKVMLQTVMEHSPHGTSACTRVTIQFNIFEDHYKHSLIVSLDDTHSNVRFEFSFTYLPFVYNLVSRSLAYDDVDGMIRTENDKAVKRNVVPWILIAENSYINMVCMNEFAIQQSIGSSIYILQYYIRYLVDFRQKGIFVLSEINNIPVKVLERGVDFDLKDWLMR
jgi:hypothetical protein